MRDCLLPLFPLIPASHFFFTSFMKLRPYASLYFLTLCSIFSFLSLPPVMAGIDTTAKDKVPPVAYVQGMIWKRLDFADFTLNGTVHSDKSKNRYPITLLTKGHELVYEFKNQALQIRVVLTPGVFTVENRTSSSAPWTAVNGTDRTHAILDTDITYEDLGIDFMNWDDTNPVGTDSIKTLPAYVFEATPGPNDHSRFAKVRYWVSTQYWCFLRVDGLNGKGQTIKRVEAQDVIKIGKYNVFKQMKVANMAPDRNDIALSTTFIDIEDGHDGSGLKD